MSTIYAAVEDRLSGAIAQRLLCERLSVDPDDVVILGLRGQTYLKANIAGYAKSANEVPFFVLTDLDAEECASRLVGNWLPAPRPAKLCFRVAAREVESWLLADRKNFARFLNVSVDLVPRADTDSIADPKRALLEIARRSRSRAIRNGLLPSRETRATIGPEYNLLLSEFVALSWSPSEASLSSDSLRRAIARIPLLQASS